MKTLKTLICLLCLLTVGILCKAQNQNKTKSVLSHEPIKESNFSQTARNAQSGGQAGTTELKGTPGSPYLFDEWNDGLIIMKDNSRINGNKYRYNIYTQQMQFINQSDTAAIANPEAIAKIQFGGKTFVFTEFETPEKTAKGYFELISEGNCSILKRYVVRYHVVDENEGTKPNDGQQADFLRDCNCYLQFADTPAKQASHNKKELLACFGSDEEKVNEFIKENNIKLKSESDLKAIVDFYNTLHK